MGPKSNIGARPPVGTWGVSLVVLGLALAVLGPRPSVAQVSPSAETQAGEPVAPTDWVRYRGPDGDGREESAELILPWPTEGPPQLWSVPVGGGFSAVAAAGNRLYTLASEGRDELLLAFDHDDGSEVWRLRTDDKRRDSFGDGPRSTPVVDGERVFAVSALGRLWAVNRHDGTVLWQHDLRRELGAMVPTWGVSASPTVEGDLLLFDVGGRRGHGIVAFDKTNGEIAWATESGIPGYSLPLSVALDGIRQTVFFTGSKVLALNPEDGSTLWSKPWKTAYDVNAAAPVFVPPQGIFISSGYDTGASLFKVEKHDGALTAKEQWHSDTMRNHFSSSVYHDGFLYGFDDKELKCLDARTGHEQWRKVGFGHGTLIYVDGHLVVLGDRGLLALVKATSERYHEVAAAAQGDAKHWTAPTFHRGRLLVRNQRQLTAIQIAALDSQAHNEKQLGDPP